ncbi:MAG: thiamine diphosphokinase [Lachnospiraceae bacterium]
MNRILIITGGEVNITSSLQYTEGKKYSKIIAVDGGLESAVRLGIMPDVILGDFDTVDQSLLREYEGKGCEIARLNPVKDDTDTEAAFLKALSYRPDEIHILGAIGSRFDHSYANIFLLKRAYEAGVKAYIITEMCRISLITGDVALKKDSLYGKYISLIQFDGKASGVTLKDFVYEVRNFDFDTDKTYRLGISNELNKPEGYIHIDSGYMLLIESKEDKKQC